LVRYRNKYTMFPRHFKFSHYPNAGGEEVQSAPSRVESGSRIVCRAQALARLILSLFRPVCENLPNKNFRPGVINRKEQVRSLRCWPRSRFNLRASHDGKQTSFLQKRFLSFNYTVDTHDEHEIWRRGSGIGL